MAGIVPLFCGPTSRVRLPIRSIAIGALVAVLVLPPQFEVVGQELPVISKTPLAVLGDSPPLFQVGSAVVMGDTIMLADGGSQRVFVFSRDGDSLATVGGRGEGPGEFLALRSLLNCGGRVLAWDARLDRFSRIEGGAVTETFRLPPMNGRYPQDVFCDRSRLVATYRVSGAEEVPLGPYRPSFEVHEFSLDGEHRKLLGEFPGDERYRFPTSDGPRGYGRRTVILPVGEGLIVGTGEAFVLEELDESGRPIREFRAPVGPRELGQREIDAAFERQLEGARRYDPSVVPALRENLRRYEYPELFPAYTEAILDDNGRLWVRRFKGLTDPQELWEVFERRSGHYIGTISMPSGERLMAVASNIVVSVWLDELEVEHLRIYGVR